MTTLTSRLATIEDLPQLKGLMNLAIENLLSDYLSPDQVKASHEVMGLDTQLIRDRTYFVIEDQGQLAGCGGWSYRETLFGGDHASGRDPEALNPTEQPGRIRAMYCHPSHTRKGVGRLIMQCCEAALMDFGFARAELMATLSGVPLYQACGYSITRDYTATTADGTKVPMHVMQKRLII